MDVDSDDVALVAAVVVTDDVNESDIELVSVLEKVMLAVELTVDDSV